MSDAIMFTVTCHWCGNEHTYELDASGSYSGPLPCDPTSRADLQVDPQQFRELIEAERASRVN